MKNRDFRTVAVLAIACVFSAMCAASAFAQSILDRREGRSGIAPDAADSGMMSRPLGSAAASRDSDLAAAPRSSRSSGRSSDQTADKTKEPAKPPIPLGPIVRSIDIQGLKKVDRRQVLRILPIREGEPMPRLEAGRLIHDIFATGFFQPDIRINEEKVDENAVKIAIVVKENPLVASVKVEGCQQIDKDRLDKKVKDHATEGEIFKSNAPEDIRKAVVVEYRRNGYSGAAARVEVTPDASDASKVAVRVIVVEGKRRILKDLIVEGAKDISSWAIRMELENRGSWGPLTSYYDDEAFESDLEKVRIMYVNKGYLNIKVAAGQFQTGGEGRDAWISPVIKIDEGKRFKMGEIKVQGAGVFSEAEIAEHFKDQRSDYYSGKRVKAALEKLTKMYGDEGYVNAQINTDFNIKDSEGVADLILKIKEGSEIRIGRVQVSRKIPEDVEQAPWWERAYSRVAPPMKEKTIMREVELKSGDVYRSYNEAKTKRRLEGMGTFDKVNIRREPTSDPAVNDVVIEADDSNETGRVAFGLGWGDATQGFAYIAYTERNLFGEARDLKAQLMLGMKAWGATIGYLDRHLNDTDWSLGVELFHERYHRRGYYDQRSGDAITLGHPLGDKTNYQFQLKTYWVQLKRDEDHEKTKEDLDKGYVVATLRPSITFDERDDKKFPTKGYQATFAIEGGYADGPIMKFETDLEHYTPLPWDLVWAKRLQYGIMPVNAKEVGITERYYLGGSDSLRGYKFRGAGPMDKKDHDVAIGGASAMLFQNELRYPITKELSVLTFYDLGLIGREPLQYDRLRHSVGVGARYRIPAVTVGVDLGFALNPEKRDQTEIFHFRMGSRF